MDRAAHTGTDRARCPLGQVISRCTDGCANGRPYRAVDRGSRQALTLPRDQEGGDRRCERQRHGRADHDRVVMPRQSGQLATAPAYFRDGAAWDGSGAQSDLDPAIGIRVHLRRLRVRQCLDALNHLCSLLVLSLLHTGLAGRQATGLRPPEAARQQQGTAFLSRSLQRAPLSRRRASATATIQPVVSSAGSQPASPWRRTGTGRARSPLPSPRSRTGRASRLTGGRLMAPNPPYALIIRPLEIQKSRIIAAAVLLSCQVSAKAVGDRGACLQRYSAFSAPEGCRQGLASHLSPRCRTA